MNDVFSLILAYIQGHFESFCDSFDIRMNNINSLIPAISIIALDFNGKF